MENVMRKQNQTTRGKECSLQNIKFSGKGWGCDSAIKYLPNMLEDWV
jgi:hypothetical protein